jgi:DNA-binding transcriptional ArsR family regulator
MRDRAYVQEGALAPLGGYEAGAALLRALASPARLAIIDALGREPRCVHELMDCVGLPQTQVSQHLRILKDARLVAARRRGREVVYSLLDRDAAAIGTAARQSRAGH